jgi:hypothetical protein
MTFAIVPAVDISALVPEDVQCPNLLAYP